MSNTESLSTGKKRGSLTIYIGYSPGVGKTFEMLSSVIELFQSNADIKIGYTGSHQRDETNILAEQLPKITTNFTKHDVDHIIEESSTIVLIDKLAYTNIFRDRHEKRYIDIEEILNHGIDVHTALNIQHIESLSSQIELIIDVHVKGRVFGRFVMGADVLEVVGTSPEQLIRHLKADKIYKKDKLDVTPNNFFTYAHLSELRTLTLRTAANLMSDRGKVRHNHKTSLRPHITAAISGSVYNETVVKEAFHIAQKEHAKFTVTYIDVFEKNRQYKDNQKQMHQHLISAKSLGAKVKVVYSQTVALGLDEWCKDQDVTKLVIGQHIRNKWRDFFNTPLIDHLMSFEHSYEVEIVPIKQILVELKMDGSPHRLRGKYSTMNALKMILIQIIYVMVGL